MTGSSQRTAIVTGGTGALGRAVVAAFLAQGDRVVVPWIVKDEAEAMEPNPGLSLVEADVSDPTGATAVVECAGSFDVLVNGVGGFGGGTPIHETELELWDQLYRLNVRTVATMCRAAIPGLIERGRGSIVNIASQAATDCPAGIAAYSASKAAVMALTRSLCNELAGAGVRANAVVPTTIDTPANRAGMPDADFSRWTPPEQIARVIAWLASDSALTVSGAMVPV